LLQIEKKTSEQKTLPLQHYNKINKLLRNLIIHSSSTLEEAQIETFLQNSDCFIEVISITLKYINANI